MVWVDLISLQYRSLYCARFRGELPLPQNTYIEIKYTSISSPVYAMTCDLGQIEGTMRLCECSKLTLIPGYNTTKANQERR